MAEDSRLEALQALIGEWDTTITMLNPDGSQGADSSASDIYRWSANGRFVEHQVDADMGGTRVQSLEVIALAPDGAGYVSRSYDPDGSVNDFTATLDEKSWSIVGKVQRFSGGFSDDGNTLSGRWEQRVARKWLPLLNVTLRRKPEAG